MKKNDLTGLNQIETGDSFAIPTLQMNLMKLLAVVLNRRLQQMLYIICLRMGRHFLMFLNNLLEIKLFLVSNSMFSSNVFKHIWDNFHLNRTDCNKSKCNKQQLKLVSPEYFSIFLRQTGQKIKSKFRMKSYARNFSCNFARKVEGKKFILKGKRFWRD